MAFIGNQPTAVPLTSSQLTDGLITTDKLAANAVTSAKILDGAIVNVDVNSTAALAYSKLNLATSIVNADISASAAIATTKLGAGAVLQVITATDSTQRSTTSTSFGANSNTLSVSITPSSASNKIFVIVNTGVFKATGGAGFLTIYRGATNLGGLGGMAEFQQAFYSSSCISFFDSPSTTSAITYQLYFRSSDANPAYINSDDGGGVTGSLTAFEIKG